MTPYDAARTAVLVCPCGRAKKFGVEAKTGEAVRKQAKPFIDWLQQSEDEDSD